MRRNLPFAVRVLLLGRNAAGLPVAITPPAPKVAPGGTIAFTAAPGAGAGGVTITPAAAVVAVGGTVLLKGTTS